ncbi:MAG: Gfo/Idh/MocA family protein, partial [Candidatus Limnocylindria bacterium]
ELLVVDADETRAASVAERSGGRPASFATVVGEADAMVVATPPELHRLVVEAGLDAGLHVLCEKPLTETLASTIELTRRVEESGAHLELGFQRRHDAGFQAARDAIGGRLHTLRLTAHDPLVEPRPVPEGPPPEVAPIFRDSSIHDFDVVRWISGQEVVDVSTEAGRRDGTRPGDPREIESAIVSMRLSDGTLAVLEASWLHPAGYDIQIELVSDAAAITGGLSVRTPTGHADWSAPADPWLGYLDRFEAAYRAELEAFLACCRGLRPPTSTARDGLEAMRIALAATRSHRDGRRISMDDIPGLAITRVA